MSSRAQALQDRLVRSASSPAANYAEAREAESHRDFIHKLQICLKELRETAVWLRTIARAAPASRDLRSLERECSELTAIFVASVRTAKANEALRARC